MLCLEVLRERRVEGRRIVGRRVEEKRMVILHLVWIFLKLSKGEGNN